MILVEQSTTINLRMNPYRQPYTNIKIPRYVWCVNEGFAAQILMNLPGGNSCAF